jgi:glycosyltransferase involved in cell wall biosynthesis
MEIKGIKYIGPIFDCSGYAQACRGNILSLYESGIPITLHPITFEKIRPDLGEYGKILNSLRYKEIDYNIVIIHTTPEFWHKYKEVGKTNVGYTIWETSKLHPDWPDYINDNVEKILVGCEWNIEVFESSGVTVPIGVVPHGINVEEFNNVEPYNISGVSKDDYMFYSIFQWTERKHPVALIKAYWHAFQNDEKVALVLKVYRGDYSDVEKNAIRETVKKLKEVTPMSSYPKMYLILDMLTQDEMLGLHARGDCYVSLDRGEGFGLNPFAAGAAGNSIIVTGFGGALEYAKEDNSYLVNYTLTPVSGMPWSPWYRGDQLWAEPDVLCGSNLMKEVYDNQEKAKEKGLLLRKHIEENFSWKEIGKKIIKELEKI